MDNSGKHLANTSTVSQPSETPEAAPGDADVVELPKRPGAPKGRPKPVGSGRKTGTKNKRTVDAERFVQPLTAAAKRRLKAVLEGDDAELALKAANLVLSYRFGKPTERREVSGPDGGAIESRQTVEAAERVVQAFGQAADTEDPGVALGDEGLRGAQAVNFLLAQRSAPLRRAGASAQTGGGVAPSDAPALAALNGAENHENALAGDPTPDSADANHEASGADLEALEPGHEAHIGELVLRCMPSSRPGTEPVILILQGHNEKLIRQLPNDLPAALAWSRAKFPEYADEPVTVRPTPTRYAAGHGNRPDQIAFSAPLHPAAHRRRPR